MQWYRCFISASVQSMFIIIAISVASLTLISANLYAQQHALYDSAQNGSDMPRPERNMHPGLRIGVFGFLSESMRSVHGKCLTVFIDGILWKAADINVGFEAGIMRDDGNLQPTSSEWILDESKAELIVFPFALKLMYRFARESDGRFFVPYVGIGPALLIGQEKMSIKARGHFLGVDEDFEAGLLVRGTSYKLNLLCGSTFRLGRTMRGVIELRWVQALVNDWDDHPLEKDRGIVEYVTYRAIKRPDFDFSGWRIDIGVHW